MAWKIDIAGGTLKLEGDQRERIQPYINSRWIEADDGDGELVVEFTGGFTILTSGSAGMPGDFNGNDMLDVGDIDLLTDEVVAMSNDRDFDLTGDNAVDQADHKFWVKDLFKTWYGDADLNAEFNSSDLVNMFGAGQYEDGVPANSSWATGDFNGDKEFGSGDLVFAFADGGYERGPFVATAVPEPASLTLMSMAVLALFTLRRRKKSKLLFYLLKH